MMQLLRFTLPVALALAVTPARAQWREAVGPPGGLVTAAAIDPLDADRIFVTTRQLCHSADGGKTWAVVDNYPYDKRDGQFQSIVISRHKDGPILISGWRLVVSLDRGKTWETRKAPIEAARYYAGAEGSSVLYAQDTRTIHRSDDHGATWRKLEAWKNDITGTPGEGWIETFFADRYDADTISFTHRSAEQTQWVLSRDGGKSFTALDVPQDAQAVLSVSTDPDDPDLLYICIRHGWRAGELRRFLFSYDDGQSWELFWDPDSGAVVPELTRKKLGQIFPEMVSTSLPTPMREKPDREHCAWSENVPGRVFGLSWLGKLYRSDDFGATWRPAFDQLVMTEINRLVFNAKERGTVYCWGERGSWLTADGGATWADLGIQQYWSFRQIAASPDGATLFVVADAVYRRKRGEEEWLVVWRPADYSKAPMAVFFPEPDDAEAKPGSTVVLVGTGIRVESTDGGATWGTIGESNLELNLGPLPKFFGELTVGERAVWLIWELQRPMLLSEDQGRTWKPFGPDGGLQADWWSRAADGAFWTVRKGKARILRPLDDKPDTGTTLRIAHPRLVTCDPADAQTAYFADRDSRLLRTTDGGKSFEVLDGGPTRFQINDLAVSPHDGALWVATSGNGVWILDKPKTHPGTPLEDTGKTGQSRTFRVLDDVTEQCRRDAVTHRRRGAEEGPVAWARHMHAFAVTVRWSAITRY
ncbi:MAG: hypothetical protein JW889_13180 [Verrucomicrobia bacterium]|nr:hypothetical protein [Verrucomicrobiota bacterium]